jgi:26S proteasome regulatory subunit N5
MSILANKINRKGLDDAGMEEYRLKFYNLLIALHQHQHDALALFKDHLAISATRGYETDSSKWVPSLSSAAIFIALSPWDNEVSDTMHKLLKDIRFDDPAMIPYKALLETFTAKEIASWPLPSLQLSALKTHEALSSAINSSNDSSVSIVSKEDEASASWFQILRKRIVQHNVRVVAKWYTRITSKRLASLLGLDTATSELVVSELASEKELGRSIFAKIDRPSGIVVFAKPQVAADVLSGWASDISSVLGLLEKTHQLIQREYVVRSLASAPTGAGAI